MGKLTYEEISKVWGNNNVYDILFQKYTAEIESQFNWEGIHAELDVGEFLADQECEGDDPISLMYVGSVFNLTPSGKYYMPWACSNVTSKEALKDECWFEALNSVLEAHGLWSQSGEGDPCDVFFCKSIELPTCGICGDDIKLDDDLYEDDKLTAHADCACKQEAHDG